MATREGNHFERRKIDEKETWFWEDEAGSQCGRSRKWKYDVQVGDSYAEAGTCPQNYTFFSIPYSGTPEQIS
jgi:hypothetical protein